jgi:HSP20 family molecular chaperone IbpA
MNTTTQRRDSSNLRQIIVRRFDGNMGFQISPIERWSDDNYAPQPLRFIERHTNDHTEIIAPLHGYDARNVHVDLLRNQVIILLSPDYSASQPAGQEYYCEVPLQNGIKRDHCTLEVNNGYLTVILSKQSNPLRQAFNGVRQLKNSLGLLVGKGWRLNHLEEPEYL